MKRNVAGEVWLPVRFDRWVTPRAVCPAPSQDGCPGVGQHEGPLVPVHRLWVLLPDFNRFLYPAVVSVVSCLITLALSQSMTWFSLLQWSVIADLRFSCCACSFIYLVCL